MALDMSVVQHVRDMVNLVDQKISTVEEEVASKLDHAPLGNVEKQEAIARIAEVKERIDAEKAKINSNIEVLESDLVENDDDISELVLNSEGSIDLINALIAQISEIANEVAGEHVDDEVEETVTSESDIIDTAVPVEDQTISVPTPDVDVPAVDDYEDKVSETDDVNSPVIIENSKTKVEVDRAYADILNPDLEGPEVVGNGEVNVVKEYSVSEALSGNGALSEKINLLRVAGRQSFKSILSRLDSYKKQMSLDHEVDPVRGANCNYDLYTMLVKNLNKQYSEVKEVLDVLCAYFKLEANDAFKEEALMRFDMSWEYGDQQLKEYKELVMVLAILCDPATRAKNSKRVNVDNCVFDINIRSNFKRYFELS